MVEWIGFAGNLVHNGEFVMQISELSAFAMLEYYARISRCPSIIIRTCSARTRLTMLIDSAKPRARFLVVVTFSIRSGDKRGASPRQASVQGVWLWVGSEMIHLMELPNPVPLTGRPEQGGRDCHTCIAIKDVAKLKAILDNAGKRFQLPDRLIFADIVVLITFLI